MASRRMRIKAVAKVPTGGKPRVVERTEVPVTFADPSSPSTNLNIPSSPAAALPPSEPETRVLSPRPPPQIIQNINSPTNFNFNCLSPSYDRGPTGEEPPTRFFSLPSPGGLISPKSPRKSPSPVPFKNPESPRRPTTPITPSSFHGENSQSSQDNLLNLNIRSPVYSPSYSALSPGYGPGIQRIHPPSPSPVPIGSPDSSNSSHHQNYGHARSLPRPTPTVPNSKKGKGPLPSPKGYNKDNPIISQVLNNSETLRQRLQSGTAVPSTSKYAMIRKDYLAKYQNNTPNPKDLTMLHYAFFNPPKPIEEGKKGEEEPGKAGGVPKKRRRTDSVASVTSVASSSGSIKSISIEKEVEGPPVVKSQSVGPRVKVGPDGQLIIDEQSLVIETSESQRAKEQLENMETVSGSSYIVGSSGIYSRKKALNRGLDWDEKETMKFYKALITCGTDFSMMATVFKGARTRGELKAKFKREDRRNPQQVSHALAKQCFDPTLALTDSEDEAAVLEGPGEGDIGDIENIKTDKKRRKKEELAKKEDFKKTMSSMKKKGQLSTNIPPKENSVPFRRPSGQVDWRLYAVMKNNLTEPGGGSSPAPPEIVHSPSHVDQGEPSDYQDSNNVHINTINNTNSNVYNTTYPCTTSVPPSVPDSLPSLELAGSSIITKTSEILLAEH